MKTKTWHDEVLPFLALPVVVAIGSVLLVPLVILRAWVLTMLWGWYVVPAFGLEPLRVIYAIGLVMIINLAKPNPSRPEPPTQDWWKPLVESLAHSLLALSVGWAASFFV